MATIMRKSQTTWIFLAFCLLDITLGSLIVSHAPEYIKLITGSNNIATSEIPDVISSTFGYSLHKDLAWNGLASGNVFKRPKAHVVYSVPGMSDAQVDLLNLKQIAQFGTDNDEEELNTESLVNNLQSQVQHAPLIVDFASKDTVYDLKAHHPSLFGSLSSTIEKVRDSYAANRSPLSDFNLGLLNATNDNDVVLLAELQLIHEILTALKHNPQTISGTSPNLFHFKITGFKTLLDNYGEKSQQVADALKLMRPFIEKISEGFKALYDQNVMIELVNLPGVDPTLKRKGRSLLEDPTGIPPVDPVKKYAVYRCSPLFPVMFNIVLWLVVVLILVTVAIAVAMWNIDPGRDSIIYRMTEQRMKKD